MHPNAGKLIFIAALPKSASSLAWLIVSALQEANGRANPGRLRGSRPHPLLPLTWDLLDRFPEGGTYKSHAPIFGPTAGFLRLVGCKYVVLLRHPADFVTALYCHIRAGLAKTKNPPAQLPPEILDKLKNWKGGEFSPNVDFEAWIHTISPVRRSIFAADVPIDEAMTHIIGDGALLKAMQWMADWLQYRDEAMSIVVTYEELMGDFDRTIERLCVCVRGEPQNDDVMAYLKHVTKAVAEEGHAKPRSDYPRGWTGSVGIWRQYFSDSNVRSYNRVVEGFLAHYPHAAQLSSVYPDLLIDPDRVKTRPADLAPPDLPAASSDQPLRQV
jgi:hypothetical protein